MRIITQFIRFTHPARAPARACRPHWRALLCGSGLAALALALSAGCVYHMPVRQGNYLDPAAVTQVRPGMTHSQVRYLLGTPMVPGAFDNSRWDYDYYLNASGLGRTQRAHVTVYFQKDVVARVVSDVKAAPITTETHGGVKYPVPF
ncbi:MAG TPA: outer membrane protein assembly factor BamE [Steroidobacteraceae bacterium]|nr:outer membrane protein assembly factor BamE [Steroidobacteraceae bacterium]